jgi:hypothetical protein
VNAEAIFADPWDSNVLYVSDLGNNAATPPVPPSIRSTPDGGTTWVVEDTLFNAATNQGEFQPFSCATTTIPNDCYTLIADMFFDRTNSNIRIAALYPGGIAFSSDSGINWVPLNVTNNSASNQPQNPIELPTSLFLDDTPNPLTLQPSLYVALRSRGLIRFDGRFPNTSPSTPGGGNGGAEKLPNCQAYGEAVMWCRSLNRCVTPAEYSGLCTVQSPKQSP